MAPRMKTDGTPIEVDEEITDVGGDPLVTLNRRMKKLTKSVAEVGDKLATSIKIDQEAHDQLAGGQLRTDGQNTKIEKKVDDLTAHVTDLRVFAASTGAHVERLVELADADAKARIKVNTAQELAEIDVTKELKKNRSSMWSKIVSAVVKGVIVISGIVAGYLAGR